MTLSILIRVCYVNITLEGLTVLSRLFYGFRKFLNPSDNYFLLIRVICKEL